MCEIFLTFAFVAKFEKSTLTVIFPPKFLNGFGNYLSFLYNVFLINSTIKRTITSFTFYK